MRVRTPAVLTLAALATALACAIAPTPNHSAAGLRRTAPTVVSADDGAHVVTQHWVDARTVDLTVHSPAMAADENVRLLVPPSRRGQPNEHLPVLYLLHGCCDGDGYLAWTRSTDVEQLTSKTNLLVVMPEGGSDGFYSNWWKAGRGGPPRWETFHLTELRQILQREFHAGTSMAIAGLSMGGYGAMKYAETGLFRAAASFSGVLDPLNNPSGVLAPLYPEGLWGDAVAQRAVWRANDPADHVNALHGVRLFVAAGNGRRVPEAKPVQSTDPIEAEVYAESLNFVHALQQEHIPLTTDFYGAGTHSWSYWQRDLHQALPMLMHAIGGSRTTG